MAAKIAFDVANAARMTVNQFTKQKAFCTLCLVTVAATLATAPLALPEAIAAMRAMNERVR